MPSQEVNDVTEKIIGCAYLVSNTLGIGFVEKVYENALVVAARKVGLRESNSTQSRSLLMELWLVSFSQIYLLRAES